MCVCLNARGKLIPLWKISTKLLFKSQDVRVAVPRSFLRRTEMLDSDEEHGRQPGE